MKMRIPDAYDGVEESVWVEPRLGTGTQYVVRSIPFMADAVSIFDIVEAEADADDRAIVVMKSVVGRSGHSTIRVYFEKSVSSSVQQELLTRLQALGCGFERYSQRYVVMTVPPDVDQTSVSTELDQLSSRGQLEWEYGYRHDNRA
jgi:hypothetical protein